MSRQAATPKYSGYLTDNESFCAFRDQLAAKGVSIRWAWSAKSNSDLQWDNVHFALFYGDGFQPTVLTAVIVDYNAMASGRQNGFGLFMDGPTNSIADDVEKIAKPRA